MSIAQVDRFILCLAWITYLVLVIGSGGLSSFIVRWQHGMVIAATSVFVLLMLGSWWGSRKGAQPVSTPPDPHQHETKSPTDQLIHTLVHCLPLFLISALGVTSLGSQAFNMAAANPASLHSNRTDTSRGNHPLSEINPDGSPQRVVTIADIYASKVSLPKEIDVIGMIYRPTDTDYERLPGNLTRETVPLLLYRYQITCCAADANPIFMALHGLDPLKYPNDTWVMVKGRLTPPAPPSNLGAVDVLSVEPIATPSEQYLSRPFY